MHQEPGYHYLDFWMFWGFTVMSYMKCFSLNPLKDISYHHFIVHVMEKRQKGSHFSKSPPVGCSTCPLSVRPQSTFSHQNPVSRPEGAWPVNLQICFPSPALVESSLPSWHTPSAGYPGEQALFSESSACFSSSIKSDRCPWPVHLTLTFAYSTHFAYLCIVPGLLSRFSSAHLRSHLTFTYTYPKVLPLFASQSALKWPLGPLIEQGQQVTCPISICHYFPWERRGQTLESFVFKGSC